MKFKLNKIDGEVRNAIVTVTDAERIEILSGYVPFIYGRGGLGIDREEAVQGHTLSFSGACFVDREQRLIEALEEFRKALRSAITFRARSKAAIQQAIKDEQAGYNAFPSGRFSDAMRGTKSFPNHPRCPFKQQARVEAWERGYSDHHEALIEAHAAP